MGKKKLSLQNRVFISMVVLILLSSILIASVAVFQYNEQAQDYNTGRLFRKENSIRKHINFEMLGNTNFPIEEEYLLQIFRPKISEIAKVHNLEIEIFDLNGNLIISSDEKITAGFIPIDIILDLKSSTNHRYVRRSNKGNKEFQASYTYLVDDAFKEIGILHLPYLEDSSEQKKELAEFLSRLGIGFLLMFAIGLALAYFISSYITRSIKTVSDKMNDTRINKRNEKIVLNDASSEIHNLVDSYNSMIDDLEVSAVKLAQSERKAAWREMAKQVAHEIKNPLTPMRLTVQSFERKFDAKDPKIAQKIKEYSNTLIQQIDVMSAIASAFSDFAKMPTQKREVVNVVSVIKSAKEIFTESFIVFHTDIDNIQANLDKMQIIRIVTNLIKNAIQATEKIENPRIIVKIVDQIEYIVLTVKDNGKGILSEDKDRVFEPKFTTKSSGMGLGLSMIKNIIEAYQGNISFISEFEKGTTFTVRLPKD
jgi:nitrogen fixation/metabolism regulation signal transduction histidine kinase|tara:strand:- start:29039 stop:30481 length:1443 start_codon:yes stop_codon:yes gene_type:complete